MTTRPPDRLLVSDKLVGRAKEIQLVTKFLRSVARSGEALLLLGEPGVGKTVLLDAGAEEASALGFQILRLAGVEYEADVSYSGLNQCLLPVIEAMDGLSAAHHEAISVALGLDSGPAPDRLVVSNAALALLRLEAVDQPLLVIVDDMQWLDRSSASVLVFVARRLQGSHIGVLAAARSGSEGLFDRSGLPECEVEPLDDGAAGGLIANAFPGLAASVRQRLLIEAQGNPLALLELPSGLSGRQRTAMRALPSVLPLSRRLQALFVSKVAELPKETRRLLLVAVLDGTGDLRLLSASAKGQHWLEDLALAEETRLVHVDVDTHRLVFRHPLIRSAVVESSTSDELRRSHLALAELLADEPERRAWHLAEASIEPDEEVAGLLEHSAHQILRKGDATGAINALTRAADLSPGDSDRSRRLAKAAFIGMRGELRDISQLLEDARQSELDDSGNLYAAAAAAYMLINGDGNVDTAHGLLVRAIEAQTERSDISAHTQALQTLSLISYLGGRAELWVPVHDAVRRLGSNAPLDLLVMHRTLADPARSSKQELDLLDAAIGDLANERDPWRSLAISASGYWVDRLGDCRELIWRVVRDGREGELVGQAINALQMLCADDFLAGLWDETLELALEGERLCAAHDYQINAWYYWCQQGMVAAARGDADRVNALTEKTLRWGVPRGVGLAQAAVHLVRSLEAVGNGDFEVAYHHATSISPAGQLASHAPTALFVFLDLVESAVRTRRFAEADAHVAALLETGVSAISPRLALLVGGSAAIAAQDHKAGELFEDAMAIPGTDRWPFDLARVQLAYGEYLRRQRATTDARKYLTNALTAFQGLGARGWVERASQELRASGQGQARTSGLQAACSQLTSQEHEIAMLAAAGMTNKEIGERLFLSHRTVGAHLYRVFPKLGITSRAALRDALADQTQEE